MLLSHNTRRHNMNNSNSTCKGERDSRQVGATLELSQRQAEAGSGKIYTVGSGEITKKTTQKIQLKNYSTTKK